MIRQLNLGVCIAAAFIKPTKLLITGESLLAFGWLAAGAWFAGIAYAFYKDFDLPMVGPFGYDHGKNQNARAFATAGMTAIFLIVTIF